VAIAVAWSGCSGESDIIRDPGPGETTVELKGCVGCHSNSDYLYEEIGPGEGGGGSGAG
jgi:hypothetical protein